MRGRRRRAAAARSDSARCDACGFGWLRPVVLTAAAIALAWSATAGADEVYAPEDGGLSDVLAADGGRLVYVGTQGEGPQRLFEGFGPGAKPLGTITVADNDAIEDLSLGTDARRRPVALYRYADGDGPDSLYRYDLAAAETRVALASRKGCSLYGPHLQRGVLYFGRVGRRARRGRPGCKAGIFRKRPGERARRLTTRAYSDFDVSKGVLAFARSRVLERGNLSDGVPSSGVNEIRLLRFGHRRSRRVASARYISNPRYQAFGGVFLNDVTLDEGHVYWVSTDEADLRSDKTRST